MKRHYLFTLTALLVFLAACSSDNDLATRPTLEPQFGTAYDDIGSDVAVTSTGNVAVLSSVQDYRYNGTYGFYTKYSFARLQLYNKNGSLAGDNTIFSDNCADEDYYGNPCYLSKPEMVVADDAGNSYVLISNRSFNVNKYNSTGSLVSNLFLGGIYETYFDPGFPDVSVDGKGNVYAIIRQDVSGTIRDVIKKYHGMGRLHWQRVSPVGTPYGITVTTAGNVYVIGSSGMARYSNTGTLAWIKTGTSYSGSDQTEVVASGTNIYVSVPKNKTIRKYDANGRLLWSRVQSGLNTLVIGDISSDTNGNLFISGKYRPTSSSPANIFVRKLRPTGAILWTKTFGTPQYDDGRGIATINGSEIYVTGETQGSLAHANIGGRDGYLRKLNSLGNTVWTR